MVNLLKNTCNTSFSLSYVDIRFLVDDGAVRAHKPLLMSRCEMMYAMFNDNFMESSAEAVSIVGTSYACIELLLEISLTSVEKFTCTFQLIHFIGYPVIEKEFFFFFKLVHVLLKAFFM